MAKQYNGNDAAGVRREAIEATVLERMGYSPNMAYTSPHMIKQAVRLALDAAMQDEHIPQQRAEEQTTAPTPDVYIPYLDN